VVLAAVTAVAHIGAWGATPRYPGPDGLFYHAQTLEIRGADRNDALRTAFNGAIAQRTIGRFNDPAVTRRVRDQEWVDYSSRFYRRRVLVPAAAALARPALGDRAAPVVGLIGAVLIGPLLFLLLRRRFSFGVSFGVALVTLVWPPVLESAQAGVDTWGVVLEIACVLSALAVAERGLRWLPAWIVAVAALSLTHDATPVVLLAALALLVFQRNRRTAALVAGGVAAALPALILYPTSVREYLAYVVNDHDVPTDTSIGYILRNEPHQLGHYVKAELIDYPTGLAVPVALFFYVTLAFAVACIVYQLVRGGTRDPFLLLARGGIVGGLLYLLLANNPTNFRLELVLLPFAAIAVAFTVERIRAGELLRSVSPRLRRAES
jgi:hypothetical protein